MTAIDLDVTDALAVFDFRRDHSPLWHWMKANHLALIARAGGDRMPWTDLCEVFARQKLFNRAGKAPTPACAKLTWHRLRAYLARANERLETLQLEREDAQDTRRAEREARREAAVTAAREVAPRQERQRPPNLPVGWQPPTVPQAARPVEQPSSISVEPAKTFNYTDDLPGLPSKSGYRSENQWYREVSKIIRQRPASERSVMEKLFVLRADMIGQQP